MARNNGSSKTRYGLFPVLSYFFYYFAVVLSSKWLRESIKRLVSDSNVDRDLEAVMSTLSYPVRDYHDYIEKD